MSINNFIPSLWAAAILEDFRQAAVAAALANRDYEGTLTHGNSVKITTGVPIEIKDYKTGVEGPRTTKPDDVSLTQTELNIDQEKSFDFIIDDIDRVQAAGNLDSFTRSAAAGLAEDADKMILAKAIGEGTKLTGSSVQNGKEALDVIRELRKQLTKAHVPAGGRVLILNAEAETLLLDSDAKLTDAAYRGNSQALTEATTGRLFGFDLVTSENLPVTDKPQFLAFHRPAIAFASQIEKTEAMRAELKFADRMRGLHVYGAKVLKPAYVHHFTSEA